MKWRAKGPADLYCVPRILSHNEKEERGPNGKKIWEEREREREREMLMTSHCADSRIERWTAAGDYSHLIFGKSHVNRGTPFPDDTIQGISGFR